MLLIICNSSSTTPNYYLNKFLLESKTEYSIFKSKLLFSLLYSYNSDYSWFSLLASSAELYSEFEPFS